MRSCRTARAGGRAELQRFVGCITGVAFAAGDTVVVGAWRRSPFGRVVDVMWRRPDGERVLLAPSEQLRDHVAGLYRFDRTAVVAVTGGWDGGAVAVAAGPLRLRALAAGRDWRSWLFALRPRPLRESPAWITLEDRLARPWVGRLLGGAGGVRAAGVAPGGQREWYGVADYRPLADAQLLVDGRDAGAPVRLGADLGVGLSAFPSAPAIVWVTTLIEQRSSHPAESSR